MSRSKSQGSRIRQLVAIASSVVIAGAAMTLPILAAAAPVSAHAARVTHHHATKSAHKARPAKLAHHHTKTPVTASSAVTVPRAALGQPAPQAQAAPVDCTNGDLVPTPENVDLIRAATICLINQQRTAAGLAPLRENRALDAAAQAHSDDMVAGDYFDHVAPSGADPLSRVVAAGFATVASVLDLGENIAAGAGSLSTPAVTVANWMASGPHRMNILDPTFQQTGLGITAAVPAMLGLGSSGATYTQTFGTAA